MNPYVVSYCIIYNLYNLHVFTILVIIIALWHAVINLVYSPPLSCKSVMSYYVNLSIVFNEVDIYSNCTNIISVYRYNRPTF